MLVEIYNKQSLFEVAFNSRVLTCSCRPDRRQILSNILGTLQADTNTDTVFRPKSFGVGLENKVACRHYWCIDICKSSDHKSERKRLKVERGAIAQMALQWFRPPHLQLIAVPWVGIPSFLVPMFFIF